MFDKGGGFFKVIFLVIGLNIGIFNILNVKIFVWFYLGFGIYIYL